MYAQANEDARDGEGAPDLAPSKRANYKRKAPNEDKAGPSNEVAAAFEGKGGKRKWKNKGKGKEAGPSKSRMSDDEAKLLPCPIHASLGKVNRTLGECRFMDDFKKDPDVGWKPKKAKKAEKTRKEDDDEAVSMSENGDPKPSHKEKKFPKVHEQLVCFLGTPSVKEERRNYVSLTPRYQTFPNISTGPKLQSHGTGTITLTACRIPASTPSLSTQLLPTSN